MTDKTIRILVLGAVARETVAALGELPGGRPEILPPALAHELLTRVAADQPDLVVAGPGAIDWAGSAAILRQILDNEFARAMRYRHPLSLLVIGVDHGERLEALHGADALERYRSALADGLRRSLRHIDVLARTGANEITVVLPETTAAGARAVAERARVLASHLIVKGGEREERPTLPIKASVSIGICDAPREGLGSSAEFVAAASTAREGAEGAGGDRVAVAGS